MPFSTEVLVLFLGVSVTVFAVRAHRHLRELPRWRWLLGAYALLMLAWTASLTGCLLENHLAEMLEHICYALSAVLLAAWCWAALRRGGLHETAGRD